MKTCQELGAYLPLWNCDSLDKNLMNWLIVKGIEAYIQQTKLLNFAARFPYILNFAGFRWQIIPLLGLDYMIFVSIKKVRDWIWGSLKVLLSEILYV